MHGRGCTCKRGGEGEGAYMRVLAKKKANRSRMFLCGARGFAGPVRISMKPFSSKNKKDKRTSLSSVKKQYSFIPFTRKISLWQFQEQKPFNKYIQHPIS